MIDEVRKSVWCPPIFPERRAGVRRNDGETIEPSGASELVFKMGLAKNVHRRLECPYCDATAGLRILPGPRNLLRVVANGLLFGVYALVAVFVFQGPLFYDNAPRLRLKRQCSACGSKFFGKSTSPELPMCGNCGYDLTGNVSGVCPECGWRLTKRLRRRVEQKNP